MTNLAEALAVALDHAEETGIYPTELKERVARLVLGWRVAGPWAGAGDRYRHNLLGEQVAHVYWDRIEWVGAVGVIGAGHVTEDAARAWADAKLRELGWVLA